ncbi:MAG TPA: SDR family oxidoreductase [Gemmatimonadales bacterium]|nr:SDR family oxidoreductase [Gemmatimonadales bacterium]
MTRDAFDLGGRVVVVTGGLGQLGRQFTSALAARGAHAVALDLPPAADAAAAPAGVRVIHADVRSRASLEAALDSICAEVGVPHALVNGAAIDSPPDAPAAENGPFEEYPLDSWQRVMDVNVTGVMLCCQVFGAAMAEAGRGSIVNISSIYGLVSPDQRIYGYRAEAGARFVKPVAYSASKSALLNLSRYLATYWAPRGVRVNSLTLAGVQNNQDARFLEGYCARIPIGRMARPDEYNGAVVFLCSDASGYMTGANLVMDGGWTAW